MRFNILFTAEPQSAQRIFILCLPLRGRQTYRTIRLKLKKLLMRDAVELARDTIARRVCVFNFLLAPLLYSRGQQKIKRKVPLRSLRLELSGR